MKQLPDHIDVTKDNIKWGKRYNASLCPIALAFIDAGFVDPSVCPISRGLDILIGNATDGDIMFIIIPDLELRNKIIKWDAGENLEPFTIDLTNVEVLR